MSHIIPNSEPQKFAAGDTLQWSRTITDYPASEGNTLTYVLRGAKEQYTITATTYQTSNYLVSVAKSVTANYLPGLYQLWAYITDANGNRWSRDNNGNLFPFWNTITITENPANLTAGASDPRTFAAKTLALVETTITALASRTVSTASVNGQSYSLQNMGALLQLRQRLREEIRSEESAALINAGLGSPKNIFVRFNPVTISTQTVPGQTTPF